MSSELVYCENCGASLSEDEKQAYGQFCNDCVEEVESFPDFIKGKLIWKLTKEWNRKDGLPIQPTSPATLTITSESETSTQFNLHGERES